MIGGNIMIRDRLIFGCRGSSLWFSQFSPAKVKAPNSFLFPESSLKLKIENNLVAFVSHID